MLNHDGGNRERRNRGEKSVAVREIKSKRRKLGEREIELYLFMKERVSKKVANFQISNLKFEF